MKLTRLACIAVSVLVVIVLTSAAYAADVQWGVEETAENLNWGFRGTPWGAEKSEVEKLQPLDGCVEMNPVELNCNATQANLSIKNVPLVHIRYQFLKEKFYGVALKFQPAYRKEMRAMVEELLGAPTGTRDNIPIWDLPDIMAWCSDTHFSVKAKKILGEEIHKGGGF